VVRYSIATIGIVAFFLLPQVMLGQSGLVPCDEGCTLCDGFILLKNIYTFLLGLLATVGVFAFVAGGVLILTARANTQQVQRGKEVMVNAIIGIVLVAGSFLVLNAIVFIFLQQNRGSRGTFSPGGGAIEIVSGQGLVVNNCDTANRFQLREDDTAGGGGPLPGPEEPPPEGAEGIACLAADKSVVSSPKLRALMRAITLPEGGPEAEDYNTLVCDVMCGEEAPCANVPPPNVHPSCKVTNLPGKSPCGSNSTAYGRYQFIDKTWAKAASKAGVPQKSTNCSRPSYFEPGIPPLNFTMSNVAQDKVMADKLKRRGALSELESGGVEEVLQNQTLCPWASIPVQDLPCPYTPRSIQISSGEFIGLYETLLKEEQEGCGGSEE